MLRDYAVLAGVAAVNRTKRDKKRTKGLPGVTTGKPRSAPTIRSTTFARASVPNYSVAPASRNSSSTLFVSLGAFDDGELEDRLFPKTAAIEGRSRP